MMACVLQRFLVALCLLTLNLLQIQSATQELEGLRRLSHWNRTEQRVASELRRFGCGSNKFQCNDGTCIPDIYYCDAIKDCPDNSDESHCGGGSGSGSGGGCTSFEFRCNNGDCIPDSYRCDAIVDCKDKSDEQNCGGSCMSNEFRCNDGGCIPSAYKCDKVKDCKDNSDESNCAVGCSSDKFTCDDGTCIPDTYYCDNIEDCPDNSDELHCGGGGGSGGVCGSKQFTCNDGKCIPESFKCDKIKDCSDNSDETNCGGGSGGTCTANKFKCDDGTCIPKSYTCDSIKDCPDNSDESHCGGGGGGGGSGGGGGVSGTASGCSNCGVKYPPDNRIMHGDETGVNEWPWQVYLSIMKDVTYQCGGSLYNNKYVITAAHCLGEGTRSVKVYVGDHNLFSSSEPDESKITAARTIIHPQYGKPYHGSDNDIAIVELSRPVTFSDRVRPVCLPGPNDDFTGKTAWVTGWGTTETGSTSSVLRETSITIWPQSQCKQRGSTDNMICGLGNTHGQTTDSCTGDSGGPLVYKTSSGKWVLIGIVSHGPFPCAEAGKPGVYTKVNNYLDWIEQNTSDGQC